MQTRRKIAQCVVIAMSLIGPLTAVADPQDASQVSPLGDPAWVASLRGPDPSKPSLNIGSIESAVPRSGTGEKDRIPDSTFRRGDSTVRNGQVLNNGRVYLIGAERTTLSKAGAILLAPGRAAELGDLLVPFVRVYVAAPTGVALDVDQLVSKRPAVGMFNALFAPAPSREGEAGEAMVASVTIPAGASNIVIVSMKDEPASGTSSSILASATAPVTERSVALLPVPPANVEERSGNLSSIPPASIVDRSFAARVAAIEDRSAILASIPPALIVERGKVVFAAPVVDKGVAATPLVPAPTEERVAIRIARAEVRQVPLERAAVERAAEVARIGKPLPGVVTESELVKAKNLSDPSTGVVQVALSTPVVVVSAKGDAFVPREPAQAPIKLAAVQKRLPSVMIDRKGGFFFM